jgi:hypothetical protein
VRIYKVKKEKNRGAIELSGPREKFPKRMKKVVKKKKGKKGKKGKGKKEKSAKGK